jgi:xanthosine utilization system XapX-like protein
LKRAELVWIAVVMAAGAGLVVGVVYARALRKRYA